MAAEIKNQNKKRITRWDNVEIVPEIHAFTIANLFAAYAAVRDVGRLPGKTELVFFRMQKELKL
jgi:hypothetical protein